MMDVYRVMEVMYGRKGSHDNVILTPLDSFYDRLCEINDVSARYSAWHKTADLVCDGDTLSVFRMPHGSASSDIFKIVEEISPSKVLFMGYCGALNPTLNIGDVIQDSASPIQVDCVSSFSTQTVDGLLDKNYLSDSDVVEMELSYARNILTLSTILVVSDLPLAAPFYEITREKKDKIRAGTKYACNLVRKWIKC